MNVIYVDELFFLNALTDYLLLLSCARLRGRVLRRTRFAAAAALGGVYAVLAAIPPLSFLVSLAVKALVSLLMAWIAFGAPPELWRGWGCFLALSSAFAGAVYGISLLSVRGGARRALRRFAQNAHALLRAVLCPRCGSFSGGF